MTVARQKHIEVPTEAEQMMALFPSSKRAHGTYAETGARRSSDRKLEVAYRTVRAPVTVELWARHLAGEYPIVAALGCDDGTAGVSCVDIDDYDCDHFDLLRKIKQLDLPLYVRKSKSGGAHVFAFHEGIPIHEARELARGMARQLGLGDQEAPGKVEFFPKPQTDRLPRGLNMPYLGEEFGIIYPNSRVCGTMTIAQFLRTVVRLDADQRAAIVAKPKARFTSDNDGRHHAESLLQKYTSELASTPLGARNDTLNKRAFHLGTMIPRGWIARSEIEHALLTAIIHWDDQLKTRDTLKRALDEGSRNAHSDLEGVGAVTEDSVALEFARRHATDLRFDHDAKSWYRWSGINWARDNTGLAFSEARNLARELAKGEKPSVRITASKASFASNVERFAQADRALVVTQKDWDQDPFLLGTPGGTVDLRTGVLREARPADGITKATSVAPGGTVSCPAWLRFLEQATSGDVDLIRFLQTLCGYAMTGDTREHLLVFIYGPGGNGKSVFLNTIAGVIGDYATAAAMETFTESRFERHPTDLAMLRGARLVTCAETTEGRAWDETRIKQLTGGDPITARFMRCNFFTFVPTFQLMIVGNHQPNLRNVTDAVKRRLAIVPFVHKPVVPDRLLEEKLRAERPGILRWMLDGCLTWQAHGIALPNVIQVATKDYFDDQDVFAQWIDQYIERGHLGTSTARAVELYTSWSRFAERNGEKPGDMKWFSAQLSQRGFSKRKSHGTSVYEGVRLKPVKRNEFGPGDEEV